MKIINVPPKMLISLTSPILYRKLRGIIISDQAIITQNNKTLLSIR